MLLFSNSFLPSTNVIMIIFIFVELPDTVNHRHRYIRPRTGNKDYLYVVATLYLFLAIPS